MACVARRIGCLFVLFVLASSTGLRADSGKDLLKAVESNDLARVEKELRKGASPDTLDESGTSVLVLASSKCEADIVRALIASGASVGKYGSAAFNASIHCSCWAYGVDAPSETAKQLLDHGVPYPLPDKSSCAKLWQDRATDELGSIAAKGSASDLTAALEKADEFVARYADVSAALREAVKSNKMDNAKLLLGKGANPNDHDSLGETPLMMAADQDNIDMARLLLAGGSDPGIADGQGRKAVNYAILAGDDALTGLLTPQGQTLSVSLATVQKDHEVYLWKGASGSKPGMHWSVQSALGKADVALKGINDTNSMVTTVLEGMSTFNQMLGIPDDAFLKLSLAPSQPSDAIVFDSGDWQMGMNGQSAPAPLAFLAKLPATGERIWDATDGNTVVLLQPTLYISKDGRVMLGGGIAFITNTEVGSSTLTTQEVTLSGRIRLPADQSMEVKPGFRIRGGGLEFDETGISLMVGTKYVKDSAAATGTE